MSYPETFTIALDGGQQVTGLEYLAEGNRLGARLILAHGAGAPQTSAFMVAFATGLARRGVDIGTFNFQYTEKHRRVPDSPSELERCYVAAIEAFTRRTPDRLLFIGGKSMGGRIATQVAASDAAIRRVVDGLVLLGYPLHPPGRPGQLRAAHLSKVGRPMLFVQGSRDSLGTPDELARALDAIEPARDDSCRRRRRSLVQGAGQLASAAGRCVSRDRRTDCGLGESHPNRLRVETSAGPAAQPARTVHPMSLRAAMFRRQ